MHHNFIIISRELFVGTLLSCHLDFIEIATTYILGLLLQYKIMKPIIKKIHHTKNHIEVSYEFSGYNYSCTSIKDNFITNVFVAR